MANYRIICCKSKYHLDKTLEWWRQRTNINHPANILDLTWEVLGAGEIPNPLSSEARKEIAGSIAEEINTWMEDSLARRYYYKWESDKEEVLEKIQEVISQADAAGNPEEKSQFYAAQYGRSQIAYISFLIRIQQ